MSIPSASPSTNTRRLLAAAVVVALVVGIVGFLLGRHARVRTDEVGCLSAIGTISCDLSDGWSIAVPKDVPWVDVHGAWHEDGRPDCLPPTGRGEEGPVRLAWVPVEVDGMGWRQVVQVTCLAASR